jgi:hypothetical protein
VSPVELTDGRGGGGAGAKSDDHEEAWPSIKHPILSARDSLTGVSRKIKRQTERAEDFERKNYCADLPSIMFFFFFHIYAVFFRLQGRHRPIRRHMSM